MMSYLLREMYITYDDCSRGTVGVKLTSPSEVELPSTQQQDPVTKQDISDYWVQV